MTARTGPPIPTDDAGAATALSPRRRSAVLAVVALALMMVVSAVSGLNVALPDLAVATGASQSQVTWIVDAYTLVFAGLLLPAGALGDRLGRRAVLLAGVVVFGTAAALSTTVSTPGPLIALRAVMGAGAAAVMPVTLSVITTSFPPQERGRAVGVWVGVAGGGAVLGLFGSGILLEFFSWSSFFGLNVVLAVLAGIGTLAVVPPSREAHPARLDPLGGLLSLLTVTGLVLAVIEGPQRGWTTAVPLLSACGAALALIAFVVVELRREDPVLDPRLFRLPGFSTGALALTGQFFASFGLFYILLQYLQYIAGQSPLRAAVSLLPLPVVLLPLARVAPRLADRYGTNRVVGLGLSLSAAGMLLLSGLTVDLAQGRLTAGLALFAAGMGLAGTPATTAITAALPAAKQGVGSAVNDTSRELGSALGIATLGTVLDARYRSGLDAGLTGLPPDVAGHARASIAFVRAGSAQLEQLGPVGRALVSVARASFVDAAGTAFTTAAAVLVCTAVVVLLTAPGAQPDPAAAALDTPPAVGDRSDRPFVQ